jgi:predicted secreted protein
MKLTLSSLVLALVLVGCAGRRTVSPVALGPHSIPAKSVTMVAGKKGEYVALSPKGTLSLELQSNTAAGYRWKLAEPLNPAVLTLVTRPNEALPPLALPPTGPTKPNAEMWVFKAVGPGTQKVRMIYSRPDQPLSESVPYDFTVNAE